VQRQGQHHDSVTFQVYRTNNRPQAKNLGKSLENLSLALTGCATISVSKQLHTQGYTSNTSVD
jgi:hypothetical protein